MDYETNKILGRDQIRKISCFLRKMFNVGTIAFPVLKVLDKLESRFPENLYYFVEEDNRFEPGVMSVLETNDFEHFCIRIRMSVYDAALKGNGASLGFICHEMCHFVLIFLFDIKPKIYKGTSGLAFATQIGVRPQKPYLSMEWQAKALCGEIMIPYERCKNYTIKQIIRRTKSSYEQAKFFLEKVVKEDKERINIDRE